MDNRRLEELFTCWAEAAGAAQNYEQRHARYGVASYAMIARQLRVVAGLWLAEALARTDRARQRVPRL
jgi:hypothetical protein